MSPPQSTGTPATTGDDVSNPSTTSVPKTSTTGTPGSSSTDEPSSSSGEPLDHGEYLLASVQITDFDAFQADYGAAVVPMVIENGGEVLVATP